MSGRSKEEPEKEEIGGIGAFPCQSVKAAGVKAIAEQETNTSNKLKK